MTRSVRILAAAVTTAVALTITGSFGTGAVAKPSNDQRKVTHDIARLSTSLDRAVKPSRIGMLPEDQQTTLQTNVEADQLALETLGVAVLAADSTHDLRQVRRDLKKVRVVNYNHAVNSLRRALEMQAQLAAHPDLTEAAGLVAGAVEKALTVTAASPKSLLKEIRADLSAAQALLDAAADEPVADEPVEG